MSFERVRGVAGSRLAPFRSRHFRWFYSSQVCSLVGTWMQELARSWVILQLVGSASAMAVVLLANAVPNALLAGLGGSVADSRGARRVLLLTQMGLAATAFGLGVLVSTGHVEYWHLVAFAAMEGCIVAFDLPAFNLVTPQLVAREDFQKALTLNAVGFHMARVVGPSLAGLLMGFGGPQSVFWFNAVSFTGVLFVLSRLPLRSTRTPLRERKHMREALRYAWGDAQFRRILLQFLLMMSLIFPLMLTTLRVFVSDRFHLDARGFGLVFAAPGLGALVGSLSFLLLNPREPLRLLPWAVVGTSVFLFGVAESYQLSLTVLGLSLFSLSLTLILSTVMVTVQLRVPDEMRGRISALMGVGFAAVAPAMSVPVGAFTDAVGARTAMWVLGAAFGLGSALVWSWPRSRAPGAEIAADAGPRVDVVR